MPSSVSLSGGATPELPLYRRVWALALTLSILSGCAAASLTPPTTRGPATTVVTTIQPSTTTTPGTGPTTTEPTNPTITTSPAPLFTWSVSSVSAERLDHSWHQGCPVPPDGLRLVSVGYWGFDGVAHRGEIVVNTAEARSVAIVFRRLWDARFPIEAMIPVGDLDPAEIEQPGQNNTSGFYCRFVEGTTTWSEHARGLAIDLNPQQNPLVDGDLTDPPEAAAFADRERDDPGIIHPDGPVVAAFRAVGWYWGGYWRSKKDYHHFSATGR